VQGKSSLPHTTENAPWQAASKERLLSMPRIAGENVVMNPVRRMSD
jgi:hypothetical protein